MGPPLVCWLMLLRCGPPLLLIGIISLGCKTRKPKHKVVPLVTEWWSTIYIFHPQKNRSARSCLQAKTQIRARAFLRFTCSSSSSSYCAWPAKPSYRNQSWGRDCSSGDKLYHCIDIMSSRVSHLPLATHCCSWENYRVVAPIPSHPYLACPHYTKVASPDNENKVF